MLFGEVIATAWLTPSMVRVVLGGEEFDAFDPSPFTDAYLNVAIPPPDAPYSSPFDPEQVKATYSQELWPGRRRYTVRRWDAAERLLTLDVVVHGDAGLGGPWAANARPGDVLGFTGPSGAYRPDPEADWHLLVGDESALPAIAASVEAIPAGAPVVVRLVCDGPDHEVDLATPGDLDLVWLHRGGDPATDARLLPQAIEDLTFPPGRIHAFVHGEAGEVREIRRHLLAERGVARADLSCSPYWHRHLTDEAWRQVKPDWIADVERDVG